LQTTLRILTYIENAKKMKLFYSIHNDHKIHFKLFLIRVSHVSS